MALGHFGGVAARPPKQRGGGGPAGIDLLEQSRESLFEGPEGTYSVIRSVVIAFSRDMTAATGNVSYTGVGFKPRLIVAFAAHDADDSVCFGSTTGPSPAVTGVIFVGATVGRWDKRGEFLWIEPAAGTRQEANPVSMDLDGFTLGWTKTGSPTGTIAGFFACYG